jgi:hypothetical protein
MAVIAPRDRLVTIPDGIPELTLGWEGIHWATIPANRNQRYNRRMGKKQLRWVSHPQWPGYQFWSNGEIYAPHLGRNLKHNTDGPGNYHTVAIRGSDGKQYRVRVNKVICEAFHGMAPGPWPEWHAAHNDNNKDNNWEWNLSWKTPLENARDLKESGGLRNQFSYGYEWPQETKDKIADSLTGYKHTEATKAKLRAARVNAKRGDDGRFAS